MTTERVAGKTADAHAKQTSPTEWFGWGKRALALRTPVVCRFGFLACRLRAVFGRASHLFAKSCFNSMSTAGSMIAPYILVPTLLANVFILVEITWELGLQGVIVHTTFWFRAACGWKTLFDKVVTAARVDPCNWMCFVWEKVFPICGLVGWGMQGSADARKVSVGVRIVLRGNFYGYMHIWPATLWGEAVRTMHK